MEKVQVTTEFTPNPDSLKFNVSAPICAHGTVHFASAAEAGKSPLAAELFKIKYVKELMIGPDHVTVIRNEKASTWAPVIPLVTEVIRSHMACGRPNPEACEKCADVEDPQNEVERKIVRILEEQIRPALARDGGDAVFCGFENGIVKLHLKGACSGCPSAQMTLKHGIESYLKEYIPEVKEVVRV
ncbi:MAG: Fe/S biogenesis protein NfuA [Candidatus Omnitrophica bacterium ADurb.Bin277]|nr:MAG: Fe/S biogenesis protein NfuA [Candidatus Omnitrophica bacterium ADurb.Bin277]